MASKSESRIMDRWRQIIHANGRVGFVELIDNSFVSIGTYNKLKSYFENKYKYELKYDKENKEWVSLKSFETDAKVD